MDKLIRPPVAFILIAAFWAQVEYRAKQMMPWVLMAEGFQPVQNGLLLDYVDRANIPILFSSLRRRHWLVFTTVVASFLIQFATVASSGLLVSSEVTIHQVDAQLAVMDSFSAPAGLVSAGSRPAANVYGILTSNHSYPIGTGGRFAFQWFDAPSGKGLLLLRLINAPASG